jgi:hypothetical protein
MALRAGRRQSTPGLNWYVGSNIQFMFDYLHGDVAKQVSPTISVGARGSTHSRCVRRLPSEKVVRGDMAVSVACRSQPIASNLPAELRSN